MDQFSIFVPRLVTTKEYFAPGHRACIGCGEALAVRHVCKALGKDVIIANATGLHGDHFLAASHHDLARAVDTQPV